MIRPAELQAFRRGDIDLAFRRWDRPRVRPGTRLRTSVGVLEVLDVDPVALSSLRAEDARRAGASSLAALRAALTARPEHAERSIYRVRLAFAGADPREELRAALPTPAEVADILVGLDRLDRAAADGPWTLTTLRIIDDNPGVRAPELAAALGRETAPFKVDVRKLKERGLTESLAIGYRLSPRGEVVLDHPGPPRVRRPRPSGHPLPRTIGAPATRALLAAGVETLEQLADWDLGRLTALHGVGPVAVARLRESLDEHGLPGLAGPG